MVVTRAWAEEGELSLNGYRASVSQDEKVLETERGNGCAIM